MDAGVRFGSDAVAFDTSERVDAALSYQTIVVDEAGSSVSTPAPYVLSADRLRLQAGFAAVARGPARTGGGARFRQDDVEPAVTLAAAKWVVATVADLGVRAPGAAEGASWGDASAALRGLKAGGGVRWQLVPEFELAQ
jgi:hypothetical protein